MAQSYPSPRRDTSPARNVGQCSALARRRGHFPPSAASIESITTPAEQETRPAGNSALRKTIEKPFTGYSPPASDAKGHSSGALHEPSVAPASPAISEPIPTTYFSIPPTGLSIPTTDLAIPATEKSIPSAPFPIPTMMAVGVANPNAHGHAITNTETEVNKACVKLFSFPNSIQEIKHMTAGGRGCKYFYIRLCKIRGIFIFFEQ